MQLLARFVAREVRTKASRPGEPQLLMYGLHCYELMVLASAKTMSDTLCRLVRRGRQNGRSRFVFSLFIFFSSINKPI